MFRNRTFLILGILFIAVFIAGYALLTGYLQPTQVVVARFDLTAGTRLTSDLLETVELPARGVPDGAYTEVVAAAGKVVTTARAAGDVITAYVAGESSVSSGLPAQLEENTVGVGVAVDQATGLVGTLREGQFVTAVAIIDPAVIQFTAANQAVTSFEGGVAALPGEATGDGQLSAPISAGPTATPEPTPTPQPPFSPVAQIAITGLKVMVVPQSFRYEELPQVQGGDPSVLFANPRTTLAGQEGSTILLQVPIAPVEIVEEYSVSPALLLALANQFGTVHLALEPAGGLDTEIISLVPSLDLATLYEQLTGLDLNAGR